MSERMQQTAASMREKMLQRYGDDRHHKHDKNHIAYRQHCRSHPVTPKSIEKWNGEQELHCSTGVIREFKLRKCRKGLVKPDIH